MRIRVAICDDETAQQAYLTLLVQEWASQREHVAEIIRFASAEAFQFAYGEEGNFDILLLDIQMKATSGLDLARELRRKGDDSPIIFITGYADYMAEGYDVAALHYLTKPVSEAKLTEVLDRAVQSLGDEAATVLLPVGGGQMRLAVAGICYAEAFSHKVMLYTQRESYTFSMRLGDMENLLGEGFMRCHRSYVVNMRRARRITRSAIVLDDGREVPLARGLYDEACRMFIHFC